MSSPRLMMLDILMGRDGEILLMAVGQPKSGLVRARIHATPEC
jgi:hypothetical protein